MPKNQSTFSIKGQLDISNITKGLDEIKSKLQSSNLGEGLTGGILKEVDTIQKKLNTAFKNLPGVGATSKQVETFSKKVLDAAEDMDRLGQKLKDFGASDKYIKENIGSVKKLANELAKASEKVQQAKSKIESSQFEKSAAFTGEAQVKTLHKEKTSKMRKAAKDGDVEGVTSAYNELETGLQTRMATASEKGDTVRYDALSKTLVALKIEYKELIEQVNLAKSAFEEQKQVEQEYDDALNSIKGTAKEVGIAASGGMQEMANATRKVGDEAENTAQDLRKVEEQSKTFSNIEGRIKHLFSATSVFYTIRRIVRGAIQDFQELDKQFNEIAIVSDYSTKEMWDSFSKVNKVAQEFGVETKNVLEVQNLYYHQGKDMAEVNKLTAQTLTLAKITGMDYERATSDLTAALNAYNIAAEDAVRVTDTIAAMDTNAAISSEELMTALTKTASIAANAGMSLESTEVFLTKMIETTREAPENLGTALKTIIARFGEVKQEIDGEEIELADINRVDTALKSIGISLLDTAGQIRDLDGVFMELSSKWDDLDRNTQRYIATIAAGSRQQSRFIAMMEDYDRTLELTEIAQDSAGLGARQLAKSQESIETSVNRLKSTWQEFYSSLITSGMIKGVLELANGILSLVNTLNDVSPFLGTIITALTIWAVKTQIIDKIIFKLGQSLGQATAQTTANTTALRVHLKSLEKSQLATMLADETTEEYIKTLIKEEIQLRKNAVAQNTLNQAKKRNMTIKNRKELGRVKVNKQFETTLNNNIDKGTSFKNIIRDAWSSGKQASLGGNSNNIKNWRTTLKNNFSRPDFAINNFKSVFSSKGGIGQVISGKLTSILSKITPFITKIVTILPKIISLVTKLFNPITALIAALTIGFAIYRKYTKLSLDDTKKVEKLQKSQEEYNKTLKEYNDLKEKAKIIEKYSDRKNLSAEQLQEQQEAAKALVNEYPELLNYIDEEGNYYLKDAKAIQAVIDKKQELLDQEATNYTELRLKYAQEGIYADESTAAGKTMKNIQSYAASIDEDTLKETAKEIDAAWEGIQFNSANYKKMMKAFGDGKKFSFDEKDMSSLFEGDISEDNWNEFLEAVKENPMILENEEDLADALHETNAYTRRNAEQVAEAFIKMNEENGMLFSQLIQGAAEEYSQIEISYAQIQIEKGDFAEDLSAEVKEGLSEIALQQAIETAGGEEKWKDLDDEDKTGYIEDATESIVQLFEALSKTEIQGINAAFTSQNVGALTLEQAADIDITAITREKQIEALETFWNQLPVEIQRQIPKDTIRNGEFEIIQTLFQIIKKSLGEDNINEFINNLATDFDTSAKMFSDGVYDTNPFRQYYTYLKEMSIDQLQAYAGQTGNMSIEEIAPYSQTLFEEYAQVYGEKGKDSALKVFNALVGNDLTTQEGIEKAYKEDLKDLGYTFDEVWEIARNASNGINNIFLDDLNTQIKKTTENAESLIKNLDGLSALLEGTGSIEQLKSVTDTLSEGWLKMYGAEEAAIRLGQLSDSITATGKGFQIGATEGEKYRAQLIEIQKEAERARIYNLYLKMNTEEAMGTLTDEAKQTYLTQIMWSEKTISYYDALGKQAINDGLVKGLEKAKEKADQLLESVKNYVTWLREFDKYQNINSVLETLEQDFEDIEFEMNFSTNTDVIKKDIEDTITNINTRMAATQGKLSAAQSNMQMQRDVIEKRNSQYVSFDADGNAIVNAQELQKLQEQIKNADEEHKPVLQAKYDEIIANVEAYKKEKDIVNESTKDLQELAKAMEDFLRAQYDAIMKVEDKLVEARTAAEDKELDAVKEKYDAIKEENDKYLESVQDMIDEERKIRDRADKEQDVKDKEKKLAMMRMDTSGIYTSSIRDLEKELEGDYRSLEDDAVDQAIDELGKSFNAQAEALDKEVKYLENVLEYKREKMVEYNEWAQDLMMQGSDAVIDYLKANDEEYYTGTAAAQANWELEWENAVAQGIAANNQMRDSLNPVFNSIMACKDSAGGFKAAIEQYGETALATNGEIEGSVETLTSYYASLVSGVGDLNKALGVLETAYSNAAEAASALKYAQDTVIFGDEYNSENHGKTNGGNNAKETYRDGKNSGNFEVYIKDNFLNQPESVWNPTNYDYTGEKVKNNELGWMYKFTYSDGKSSQEVWFREASVDKNKEQPLLGAAWYKKYAKGGYVDYTGPAWVDGTKSHPEYMLNATQTQQFETLVAVLSNMYGAGATPIKSQTSQKLGDAYYNFHINVEQMASDYDVDQFVSRLEEKMVKASQYRNITVLKKSQ